MSTGPDLHLTPHAFAALDVLEKHEGVELHVLGRESGLSPEGLRSALRELRDLGHLFHRDGLYYANRRQYAAARRSWR